MQYDDNAEKYGYEGEMTPLKCDKLTAYKADVTIPVYGTIADAKVYLKKDVDKTLAENDKELCHHKYKRCLAMAKWCRLRCRLFGACGLYEKKLWALKWHKRWLELAERFKFNGHRKWIDKNIAEKFKEAK